MMLRNGKRMSHSDRDFIINNGYIEQTAMALPSVPQSAPSCLQTTAVETDFEPPVVLHETTKDCSHVESGISVVRSRLLGGKAHHCVNHENSARCNASGRQVRFNAVHVFLLSILAMAVVWFLTN